MESAAISDSSSPVAMAELEDEFRNILLSHTIPVKTESISVVGRFSSTCSYTDSDYSSWYGLQSQEGMNSNNSDANLIPIEAIDDLRRIAERMIAAGYSRECVEAYASVRRTVLDESFKKLGIEKLSSKTIQRLEWAALKLKIRRWIHAAEIAVRVLFADERRLSEQIFRGLGTNISDACFMETVKDFAINLFNFVDAISSSRRSPEKLFRILDLYEFLSDILPDIQGIFGAKSGEFFRKQAVELLSSLSEAARETLSEFEKAVFGEPTKFPIPGGSIHPLTERVMKYLDEMAGYKQELEELIVSNPSTQSRDLDVDFSGFQLPQTASPFVLHLACIISNLKSNLVRKSKQYNDAALGYLFMMNNVHEIVWSIKMSSKLEQILGIDYLNRLTGEYRLAAHNYRKKTWDRVLGCLREDAGNFFSGVFKPGRRQRLKAFNGKFKKMVTTQANWVVPDFQLREELRNSIMEDLIPVYSSFPQDYIDVYPIEVSNLFGGSKWCPRGSSRLN